MLRNILRETVCMRFLIAFIIGIIGYEFLYQYISILVFMIVLVSVTLIVLVYSIYLLNKYNYTFNYSNGMIVFSSICIIAFLISYTQDHRNFKSYIECISGNHFRGRITGNGKLTSKNCIYEIELIQPHNLRYNSLLSVKDSSINYSLNDEIEIKAKVQAIDYPSFPGQFDYKDYLIKKHIYHRFQVERNQVKLIRKDPGYTIQSFSNRQRATLLNILRTNILDQSSYEMAAALLLGERSNIDKQLLKSYSETGTIHIISVSGLHVGIIFIVLKNILKFLPFFKKKVPNCLAILVCIWFYSTLTGLPASVIRSALMISFSIIGKTISSRSNNINHVAASALVLLSINTNYLFDIGFQLSYLAVLGIMYLQKPISELYYPNSKIMYYIWETTSVSLAAQLFTLPLSWFYFHQFPNYFIVANLLAIPLSSIALYSCIALMVCYPIPFINKICEWALMYSIKWMNTYLMWIANWPNAVSKLPRIDLFDTFLISLIIFFFLLYWKEKIIYSVKYILICLMLICTYHEYKIRNHMHPHIWICSSFKDNYYTIENQSELIHFLPKSIKFNKMNSNIRNWKNYSDKKNRIILVNHNYFQLNIGRYTFPSRSSIPSKLGNNYRSICLN